MVPRSRQQRIAWTGVVAAASLGGAFIVYGFGRWWPGCDGFNTELQQAVTPDRARWTLARCPDVTAADVRVALLADTIFPLCYATALAGLLLLMACSKAWQGNSPWCIRLAAAAVLA